MTFCDRDIRLFLLARRLRFRGGRLRLLLRLGLLFRVLFHSLSYFIRCSNLQTRRWVRQLNRY